MSKFAYSFTLRIFESPPYIVSSGPDVPNSTLVIPSLVTLPPLDLTIPREKSVFDQLLEKQENNRIGNRHELDYVAVTAHSPLHRVSGQRTPAWIVTHMGIEGEEKVSEWQGWSQAWEFGCLTRG